jgi:Rrf2 family transcriptional regulator, cysteine metabolism repressor
MRISAKSEYAIKAVLDLAIWQRTDLVPIQAIASRQRIPQRYLEQVLLALKRAGIVTSKRGSSGGYHLTRAADRITVGDVLRAVEGHAAPFEALTGRRASIDGHDLAELWSEISEAVSSVVDRLTFGDLAARAQERTGGARAMYHI